MSGKGQIIVLTVYLEPTEATKTMKFPADIPIHSIITDIQKIQGLQDGGRDHGLFRAPVKQTMTTAAVPGMWMERSRTLKYYNIKNNQLVEYKKKHRPMTVKLIDDSEHSFVVDDSQSTRKISDKLGEYLQLGKDAEQFCLCYPGSTIRKPLWLDEGLSLHDQPEPKSSKKTDATAGKDKKPAKKTDKAEPETATVETNKGPLLFWKRYYAHDSDISKITSSFVLNLYFIQTMRQILTGLFPLGRVDAKNFGALQLQATRGNHKEGEIILPTEFLPPMFATDKKLPIDVMNEWKRLNNAKEDTAKNRYIQLARSMKTYGMTFYEFTETKLEEQERGAKKPKKQKFIITPITLAVAATKLSYYAPDTNQFTKIIPYTSLKRFELLQNVLTLMLAEDEDGNSEQITLESPSAEEVYSLIEGYIAIILREREDTQKVISDEDGSIAEIEEDEAVWFQANAANTGRGFQNPNAIMNFGGWGPNGPMMADPEENAMMSRVNTLDEAIKGMKGISDHIATGKGAWGKKKSEAEWEKDLTNANVFIAPALADFLEECRLQEKGNRRMLDVLAKNVYAHALNMTQAGQQLAAINSDSAALLDGAKAVADSLADIMALCSDEKNPPSEALLDACMKQHNIIMHLIKSPELLHHIDSGSNYLLMNCLYEIDNQANMLIGEAVRDPEKIAAAKLASQIKGLAMSSLAALIPYATSPQILSQIEIAENMLLDAMAPLGLDTTKLKAAIALLGVGKTICEGQMIDGSIDITSTATDLLASLALIRAEMSTGNTTNLYNNMAAVQKHQGELHNHLQVLIPKTEEKLSNRLEKADKTMNDDIDQLNVAANMLMTDNLGSNDAAKQVMRSQVLEKIGKLEEQAQLLVIDVGVLTTLNNLRHHSKEVAADMVRLKTVAEAASEHVPSKNQKALQGASKDIATSLNALFTDLKKAKESPNNLMTQTLLMNVVQKEMPEWEKLITTSTDAVPLVKYSGTDELKKVQVPIIKEKLQSASEDAANSTKNLKKAVKRMGELEGNILICQALGELEMIKATVENAEVMASQGQLPFDHRLDALASAIKVQKASARFLQTARALVNASTEQDAEAMPELIMNNVNALERLVATQQNLAGITSDKRLQSHILHVSQQTVQDSINLIAVSRLVADTETPKKDLILAKDAQKNLLDHLVSLQTAYGESDYEEIKSLKDDIERKKFKIAMGPLQSTIKTQPVLEQQALLLARALNISTNQLIDAALYTPTHTRFPLSVYVGVTVDLLDQVTFHPKLTGDVKADVGEFHEEVVKVIDSMQALGKTRNQENIDNLLNSSNAPLVSLKKILDKLLGPIKVEVHQSVLDLMRVLDEIEGNSIPTYTPLKNELLDDLTKSLNNLNKSVEPISKPNDLVSSDPQQLINVAKEAAKVASCIAVSAESSRNNGQPMSIAATQLIQACDIAVKNQGNNDIINTLAKATPAKINNLIAASKIAIIQEPNEKLKQAQFLKLEDVVGASRPFIKSCASHDDQQILATAEVFAKKINSLQEALYQVPANKREINPHTFTPNESDKLTSVAKAVAVSTANLLHNSLIKENECNSKKEYEENQEKARAEFENNVRVMSKLLSDREENKDLLYKTAEVVRLASYQLISAETTASFNQPLALPEDFDKESSTHSQDAYNATIQGAVNLKNILDAYKTNDTAKLNNAIAAIKNSMGTFAHQLVTTAAQINDNEKQLDLLSPSVQYSLGLLPLLKAIETNDINDSASFPIVVQAALPVINTLKQINIKFSEQFANQEKIEEMIKALNAAIQDNSNKGGSYEQNRVQLVSDAHKVGLSLAQLTNAHNDPQLILQSLNELSVVANDFIKSSKASIATCTDASVKQSLIDLTNDVNKAIVKAFVYSKDEIVGINLHANQLQNFHGATDNIDKIVNLLNSVEKVLLEGTAAEILNSIHGLTKLKLMVENGELAKVDNYAEKSSVSLLTVAPEVGNNGKKLKDVFITLNSCSDMELGTQANNLANATKKFDDTIYDTVFTIHNRDDQLALLDNAISVTLLASESLNPKLGSTGRQGNASKANSQIDQCTKLIENVANKESQEKKNLEAKYNDTINKLRSNQPTPAPKANATVPMLVEDSQNILAAVSKIISAKSQADAVNAASTIPDLYNNLLSCELGFPDLDSNLKDEFLDASKQLSNQLAEFLAAQARARDKSDNLDISKVAPQLDEVVNKMGAVINLTRKLPNNEVTEITDSKSKDIEQQTEDELLKCAQMINDAVKLLDSVKPGTKKSSAGISTADVAEAILEAARAIGMSVSDLVTAACQVQSERKVASQTSSKYNVDPAWANGLVSAAQLVTENVRQLVQCANASAKGGADADEERLVAISRNVAAVTIQLLTASRTKAEDPTAPSQRTLTKAAAAVQNSTGQLVVAAQAAQEMKESAKEEDFSKMDFSAASGLRAQMEQLGKIEKLEKELRDTHQDLIKLRRARYQNK